MSNFLRIELGKEQSYTLKEGEFIPTEELSSNVCVYACCDGIKAWIGEVSSEEELYELVGPENIIETLIDSTSEDEFSSLDAALFCCDQQYKIIDKYYFASKRTCRLTKEEEEDDYE